MYSPSRRLVRHLLLVHPKRERGGVHRQDKVLGNLVLVDAPADPQTDLALSSQPSALDHPLHLGQLPLGGRDQRDAGLRTVLGDERVPTNHQPLPRVVAMGDLHQITLVEQ